jgi:hypothetical protein
VLRPTVLPRLRSLEKHFVFLTPAKSAAKLMRGMGKAVMQDSEHLGLTIEVIGLILGSANSIVFVIQ